MPTVLIIGASSGIGLRTVEAALAAGHRVRALARSAPAMALRDAHLERIGGDARDAAVIKRGLEGVDAVIEVLGVPITPRTVLEGTTVFSEATRVLVDAMRNAGVRRLIAVTGIEAGDSRGSTGFLHARVLFPLILQRIYADKSAQEALIRQSGLDWTIVRPGILTDGPATGRYRVLVEPRTWRGGVISRRDVAGFLLAQVGDESCIGRTPVLVG
jgi:nucleoside-diphosphate-sugar epimerase